MMKDNKREEKMTTRSLTMLAAGALTFALAAGATAADLPQRIKDAGGITAAIVTNYPPMDFKDTATNEIVGVDPDLGAALAAKLGVKIQWQEVAFEQMISGLKTGRFDIILSGMSDTKPRQEVVDFVDYLLTGPQFYTTAANAATLKEMTDLCGKNVGTSRRTNFPQEIEAWSKEHCEAAQKPAIKVVGTEGSADARTQLKQGRVDAAVQGSETIPYIMQLEPGSFAPVGAQFSNSPTGLGVAKENTALRDAIAAALDGMIQDGSYGKILAKWGLSGTAVQKAVINGGN